MVLYNIGNLKKEIDTENVIKEKLKEIQTSITRNNELKSELERSEKELNIKKEVIVSLENERKLIEQTDSLSGLISLYRNIEKRENDLKESVSAKNRLEINLGEYNGKSELLRKEIEEKKGEYDLFVNDEPLFLEKLKESRQLETEIKGVLSAIEQLEKGIKSDNDNILRKKNNIASYSKNLQKFQFDKDTAEVWIKKNESRKGVAENVNLIVSNLENCQSFNDQISKSEIGISNKSETIEVLKKNILSSSKTQTDVTNTLKELYKKRTDSEEKLKNTDIVSLRTKFDNLRKEQVLFLNVIQFKESYNALISDELSDASLINDLITFIEKSKTEIEESNKVILQKEASFSQQKDIVDELSLALSNNLIELREHLQDGKECPLCGSTHHPFSQKETSVITDILSKAKEKYQILESDLNKQKEKVIRLKSESDSAELRLKEAKEKQSLLAKKKDALLKDYSLNSLSSKYNIEEVTLEFLKQDNLRINNEAEELEKIITDYEKENSELTQIKEKISKAEGSLSDLKLLCEKRNGEMNVLVSEITGFEKDIKANKASLEKALTVIDRFFTNNEWRKNLKENSDLFVGKIRLFAKEWENSHKKITESESGMAKNIALIESEEKDYKQIEKELTEKSDKNSSLKIALKDFGNKKDSLFGGKTADEVATQYRLDKDNRLKDIEIRNNEWQKLLREISTFQGQKNEIEKTIEYSNDKIKEESLKLDQEIDAKNNSDNLNLTRDIIISLSEISSDEINAARTKYTAAREELINAGKDYEIKLKSRDENTLDNERKINDFNILIQGYESLSLFEDNEITNLNYNSISPALEKLTSLTQQKEARRSGYAAELLSNERNKKNLDDVIKELEKKEHILADWALLNQEIGSAAGDKFKKIAQEYTLDMLLRNANVQISKIAPRYRLERIENSLALQVIDRDMCDQIRSVHSLSGGETFLVSLTLALALSSLSTRNINIESLFIDEGFGTLDSETLNIVMDALEALRLQGRKVGIITHVKEMTEKIPVRIVVNKERNGASTITIEG